MLQARLTEDQKRQINSWENLYKSRAVSVMAAQKKNEIVILKKRWNSKNQNCYQTTNQKGT